VVPLAVFREMWFLNTCMRIRSPSSSFEATPTLNHGCSTCFCELSVEDVDVEAGIKLVLEDMVVEVRAGVGGHSHLGADAHGGGQPQELGPAPARQPQRRLGRPGGRTE
jgi:hypothetical protein